MGYEFGRKFGPALRRTSLGRWVGEHRWQIGRRVPAPARRQGGAARPADRGAAGADAVDGRHERHAVPDLPALERGRRILWGGGCVLLGWAFASALNRLEKYLTWAPLAALAVVVVVVGAVHWRRRAAESAR